MLNKIATSFLKCTIFWLRYYTIICHQIFESDEKPKGGDGVVENFLLRGFNEEGSREVKSLSKSLLRQFNLQYIF